MNTHAKTLLAGAMLALSGFAAQAQQAEPAIQADAQAAAQAKADEDRHCLRYTGSLVVAAQNTRDDANAKSQSDAEDQADAPRRGRCIYSNGRAYSQDDIRRTGQTDIGRALQMLDPSVSLGH
jgi:hypothetical protein